MNKIDRFWSHEAQNIRCVRESDYDRDTQALKARVAELESALRLAKPCVEQDLKSAVKENFGYVNNDPWACAAVDARNAIDAALAGQQQQGEPHNCELEGGHLPIGWGGLVFCELCSARLPDEPELDKSERAAALAPAAVVMPERMTTIPEGKTISYAAGYEAALDAVADLNRSTVSLELLERAALNLEIFNKRPVSMCRDCADCNGICQNTGLECDIPALVKELRAILQEPSHD